jgi:pimeloyl-ACP methyl ester carboxylesterase
MERRVGNITIESIAAETDKFAAPMILVHGLWCRAAVWHRFMGYLAHRGWTCHAVNLRGHGDAGGHDTIATTGIADYLSDLERVIALCETAPIIVGHDLGGLLALAASPAATRAVVALAPIVPRAIGGPVHPVLTSWRVRLAMWRGRPVPPPRGNRGAQFFAAAVPGGNTADSPRAVLELNEVTFELKPSGQRPALVIAGDNDAFCPAPAVGRLAQHVGAQWQTAKQARHALPWDAGWERHVAATHRWIIQTLGESLLLLRGTEDD